MNINISFSGKVKQFSGDAAWFYIEIPKGKIPSDIPTNQWGFSKATATINSTSWETSVMPMGKGKKFIALKKQIRNKEKISKGDTITVSLSIKID